MESMHIFNDTLFWAVLALGSIAKIARYRPIDGLLGILTIALYGAMAVVVGFVVPPGPVGEGVAWGLLIAFVGDLLYIGLMELVIGNRGRDLGTTDRAGYDEAEAEWH